MFGHFVFILVTENGQGAASGDNDEIWRPRFHTRNEVANEESYRIQVNN